MRKNLRFLIAATLALSAAAATPVAAQVICSGDMPPQGTAIIATGTSSICGGACRARQFSAVQGATMIICAQQPIPAHYTLQSVTASPSCGCLGDQDNAYVIKADSSSIARGVPAGGAVPPAPFQIGN